MFSKYSEPRLFIEDLRAFANIEMIPYADSYFKPTIQDICGCIELLRSLNCLPRWSAHIGHLQDNYVEVSKLGLNCQLAAVLFMLIAYEQEHNIRFTEYPKVRLELLPRIALFRAFEKFEKCDILDETYGMLFDDDPELKSGFENYMNAKVIKLTSPQFFKHISGLENTFEMKIFKAATAVATYYESLEIKRQINEKRYADIQRIQFARLKKYEEFPLVSEILNGSIGNSEYFKLNELIENFSSLRNRIRWVKRVPLRCYSVLGHSFDVAVYNYLLALHDNPTNIAQAQKGFFVGLYHDIAEVWTGDMPSPLKDAIPGLRKKTEELEVKMLEEHVFPFVPSPILAQFKGFMLEMLPQEDHDYFKFGDNLAAYVEASTQILVGSKDPYFVDVVADAVIKTYKLSPIARKIMTKVRKDASISKGYVARRFILKKIANYTDKN